MFNCYQEIYVCNRLERTVVLRDRWPFARVIWAFWLEVRKMSLKGVDGASSLCGPKKSDNKRQLPVFCMFCSGFWLCFQTFLTFWKILKLEECQHCWAWSLWGPEALHKQCQNIHEKHSLEELAEKFARNSPKIQAKLNNSPHSALQNVGIKICLWNPNFSHSLHCSYSYSTEVSGPMCGSPLPHFTSSAH